MCSIASRVDYVPCAFCAISNAILNVLVLTSRIPLGKFNQQSPRSTTTLLLRRYEQSLEMMLPHTLGTFDPIYSTVFENMHIEIFDNLLVSEML